jgi:hypothetical protein
VTARRDPGIGFRVGSEAGQKAMLGLDTDAGEKIARLGADDRERTQPSRSDRIGQCSRESLIDR